MKQSAFDDFSESAQGALEYAYTQCKRTDGTIYGTAGDCAQKGATEVKTGRGGNDKPKVDAASLLYDQATGTGKYKQKRQDVLMDSITSQDNGRLKSLIKSTEKYQKKGQSGLITMSDTKKRMLKDVASASYEELTKREIAEGKKPTRMSALISQQFANKLGINIDEANAKAEKAYVKAGGTAKKNESISTSARRQKVVDALVAEELANAKYKSERVKNQWPNQRVTTMIAEDTNKGKTKRVEQQQKALKQQTGSSGVDKNISKEETTAAYKKAVKELKSGGVANRDVAGKAKSILSKAGYPVKAAGL